MKIKVKVILPFFDAETKIKRKKNDVFEVTAKRLNDILRKGRYVEIIEDDASATVAKKTEK